MSFVRCLQDGGEKKGIKNWDDSLNVFSPSPCGMRNEIQECIPGLQLEVPKSAKKQLGRPGASSAEALNTN